MNIQDQASASALRVTEKTTEGPIRAYAPATDYWYVVRYRSGVGNRVLDLMMQTLRSEGFETYRPMFMRMKRQKVPGRKSLLLRAASEPLYGDYMFVRRMRPGKTAITAIYGIEGAFLGAVRNEVIEAHRKAEQDGHLEFVRRNDPSRHLIGVGDTVEHLDWLIEAVVSEVLPGQRLALLSTFLGDSSRLIVNLAQVVRVQAAPEVVPQTAGVKPGRGVALRRP